VLANNGREAIARFSEAEFDLVLMDVQMPVMDGLEATRALREVEQADDTRTAIIAMTAHAMEGDRERCLASGMDEYLTKPIRAAALMEKVAAVLAQPPAESPASETEPLASAPLPLQTRAATGATATRIVHWEKLNSLVHGDRRLRDEIIEVFLQELETLENALEASLRETASQQTASTAHTLKGAAFAVGAETLCQAAQRLEQACRDDDPQARGTAFLHLQQTLARIRDHIREVQAGNAEDDAAGDGHVEKK
jgi:CheY-like chemotaxis protein